MRSFQCLLIPWKDQCASQCISREDREIRAGPFKKLKQVRRCLLTCRMVVGGGPEVRRRKGGCWVRRADRQVQWLVVQVVLLRSAAGGSPSAAQRPAGDLKVCGGAEVGGRVVPVQTRGRYALLQVTGRIHSAVRRVSPFDIANWKTSLVLRLLQAGGQRLRRSPSGSVA